MRYPSFTILRKTLYYLILVQPQTREIKGFTALIWLWLQLEFNVLLRQRKDQSVPKPYLRSIIPWVHPVCKEVPYGTFAIPSGQLRTCARNCAGLTRGQDCTASQQVVHTMKHNAHNEVRIYSWKKEEQQLSKCPSSLSLQMYFKQQ